MVDQLCSVADVKVRMLASGQPSDAVDDTLLTSLVDQVSAWVAAYTGRKFGPETAATYVFDTVAGYTLSVPRGIRSITSMGVASTHQPDSGGTYTTVPAADRILRPKAADTLEGWPYTEVRIARSSTGSVRYFSTAENGCTITGDFGFAAVPSDVKALAIDAVVIAYANRSDGVAAAIGPDGTAIPAGLTVQAWATLDRYRDWARGVA